MRLYCLTYDAKNSRDAYWNGNNIKDTIVGVLQDNLVDFLDSPIASTIVFGSYDNDINFWNTTLLEELGDKINFFLCLVAYSSKNKTHYYRMQPDKGLEKNFKKSL